MLTAIAAPSSDGAAPLGAQKLLSKRSKCLTLTPCLLAITLGNANCQLRFLIFRNELEKIILICPTYTSVGLGEFIVKSHRYDSSSCNNFPDGSDSQLTERPSWRLSFEYSHLDRQILELLATPSLMTSPRAGPREQASLIRLPLRYPLNLPAPSPPFR